MNTHMLTRRIKGFGHKTLAVFVAIIAVALSSNTAFAVTIPSNFFTVVDSGGANDINSTQLDLTRMGRDDSDPTFFEIFWSWDATDFTAQTGNACALFDTDEDSNINYAICAEVHNVPSGNINVVQQTGISPVVVTCNDSKSLHCGNPSGPLPFTSSDL